MHPIAPGNETESFAPLGPELSGGFFLRPDFTVPLGSGVQKFIFRRPEVSPSRIDFPAKNEFVKT